MRTTGLIRKLSCIAAVAAASAALALAGCQHNDKTPEAKKPNSDEWAPDDSARAIWKALDHQAIAGARADATLGAQHFDGDALNSLGATKLGMMIDAQSKVAAVYLNLPADDAQTAARRASVQEWLHNAGIASDAFAIKDGPNPATANPAAPNLSRMWKTESPGPVAAGTSDDTSGLSTGTGMSGAGAPAGGGTGSP